MRSALAIAIVGVLLASAASTGWITRRPLAEPEAPARVPTTPRPAAVAAPRLEGTLLRGDSPMPATKKAVPAPPTETRTQVEAVTLRVTLTGVPTGDPDPVCVRVLSEDAAPVSGTTRTDAIALDIGQHLRCGWPDGGLWVHAAHPRCPPASLAIEVPEDRQVPRRLEAHLVLPRGIPLRGRVRHEGGGILPYAFVVAYAPRELERRPEDSTGPLRPVAMTVTEGDAWTLWIPEPGPLVVVAWAGGVLHEGSWIETVPGAVALDVSARSRTAAPDIVLSTASSLSGTLLVNGRACADRPFAARARTVPPKGAVLLRNPFGIGCWWTGEAVLPRSGIALVAADGSFTFDELPPGLYDVGPFSGSRARATRGLADDAVERVRAPGTGVHLSLDALVVELVVSDAESDGAVEKARIDVEGPRRPTLRLTTNAEGHARVLLALGDAYTVRVCTPGYREATLALHAPSTPAHIRREIRLERVGDCGRVKVLPRDTLGRAYPRAEYGLRDDAGRVHPVDFVSGAYRADVPTGTYLLQTKSTLVWGEDDPRKMLPPVPFEVEAARTVTLRPIVPAGGRLCLTARGPGRLPVPAQYSIVDADGRPLRLPFLHHVCDPEAGWTPGFSTFPRRDGIDGARSHATSPVAPGWYTVTLRHPAYGRAERRVEIRAGETTTVDARLE